MEKNTLKTLKDILRVDKVEWVVIISMKYICSKFEFCFRYYYTSPGGFTSVHGVGSSSEYAKRRKESLETEFGHILGARSRALFVYARFGPFLALYRASIVSFEVAKLTFWHFVLKDIHKRAEKVVFFHL